MKTFAIGAVSLAAIALTSTVFATGLEPKTTAFGGGAPKHTYSVTIENRSSQVITPPVLAAHGPRVTVFEPWAPASDALAVQAETGNPDPLAEMLAQVDGVDQVVVGDGVIAPGESATFEITTRARFLTATAMLATTNDAFFGLKGVDLPRRETTLMAPIYDAGSEANNELCSHIPGPPCAADSGNDRLFDGAEGIIAPHGGLNGQGDLDASSLNWAEAPVHITITPIS